MSGRQAKFARQQAEGRNPPGRNAMQVSRAELQMRSGPLPHPDELARYSEIIPNGADRIMRMAEEQSRHRIDLERTVVKGDNVRAYLGLACAFAIAIFGLWLSYNLVLAGQTTIGTVFGGGTLIALVGVFVYGNESRKRERERKARGR